MVAIAYRGLGQSKPRDLLGGNGSSGVVIVPAFTDAKSGPGGPAAQQAIHQLSSDSGLAALLAKVPNITLDEEQGLGSLFPSDTPSTDAIDRRYHNGEDLPEQIRALREEVKAFNDPAALNLLDSVICQVIRNQHPSPSESLNDAIQFGPPPMMPPTLSPEAEAATAQAAQELDVYSLLPETDHLRRGLFFSPRLNPSIDAPALTDSDRLAQILSDVGGDAADRIAAKKAEIVAAQGPEAGERFDSLVLERILATAQRIDGLIDTVPNLLDLADGPNRPGIVVAEGDDGRDLAAALEASLEGKDADPVRNLLASISDPAERDAVAREILKRLVDATKHNFDNFKFDDANLYLNGGPRPEDVMQGGIGDCWLLAGIGILSLREPQAIRDAISYDPVTQSFNVTLHTSKGVQIINVTQDDLFNNLNRPGGSSIDNNPNHDGAAWPAVLEVAVAKANDSDWSDGLDEGYADIEGDKVTRAFELITGRHARTYRVVDGTASDFTDFFTWPFGGLVKKAAAALQGDDGLGSDSEIAERVYDEFQKGGSIAFGGFRGVDGVIEKHAYMVVDVWRKDGDVYAEIRNPWGHNPDGKPATQVVKLTDIFSEFDLENRVKVTIL